jgi:hypothetical protein
MHARAFRGITLSVAALLSRPALPETVDYRALVAGSAKAHA